MNNVISKSVSDLINNATKPLSKFVIGLALLLPLGIAQAAVAPISVTGNQVLFGGTPGSVAGNSMFWSNVGWGGEKYYNASVVSWLKTDFNSNLVRAAMGVEDAGGYLSDAAGNKAKVKAVVDAAIANNMYVIIDWHSHHAEQYQAQSIAFFQEMATTYGAQNNVIYEIYNEPLAVSWSGAIKPYATAVIQAIRAIDPDNLIVVGTPSWSQDVDVASADKITGYANIAYTLHFYAGTHGASLRAKAQTALNNGIALFVTEWGSVNADGGGAVATSETNAWVDFMKTNKISNANWSVNDKAEGASLLVPGASATGGWVSSQLTASGANAKSIILGWPALTGTPTSTAASSVATSTAPANNLPFTIQAESYSTMVGIQTETTLDVGGGLNVGYTDANDSMAYANTSINIPANGSYKITYRVASLNGGGSLALKENGGVTYDTFTVPSTGGWQTWVDVSRTVTLTAGVHKFALGVVTGGFNLNWFKIESIGAASSAAASSVPASSRPASSVAASSVASGSTCGSANFNKTAVKGLDVTAVAGDCIKYTKDFGTLQIGSWSGITTSYNITSGAQGVTNTGGGWTAVTASNTTLYIKVASASRSFAVKFDHW